MVRTAMNVHYQVKLADYEGPLDLLLKLVQREEISIGAVSVRQVIDQYLAYLGEMEWSDIDEGGRFLVMAATLLAVKAQLLLPRHEDPAALAAETEEEEELDFDARLQSYLEFRRAAESLGERAREWQQRYRRLPAAELPPAPKAKRDDLGRLVQAMQELLARRAHDDSYRVERMSVDLWETMDNLLERISYSTEGLYFESAFAPDAAREEIVVTFLALLELVFRGRIRVSQEEDGMLLMQCAPSENSN